MLRCIIVDIYGESLILAKALGLHVVIELAISLEHHEVLQVVDCLFLICHRWVRLAPLKSRRFFTFWPLFVCSVLLTQKALCAEVAENARWSLQFQDVSISEALEKISRTTGIEIVLPDRLGNQVITRSYKDKTIEHILKDILRDMNYALVWSHGEKGIDSVRILALDKAGGAGATDSSDAVMPNIEDTDSEASAEPEKAGEEQAEADAEQEDEEQMSSSEEPSEETPEPPKKMPARSDESVE